MLPYPEVNIEVTGTAKLPVAGLESNGHDIVLVELLVEALAAVGGKLDIVGERSL